MNRILSLILLLSIFLTGITYGKDVNYGIIPAPRHISETGGGFTVSCGERLTIVYDVIHKKNAQLLKSFLDSKSICDIKVLNQPSSKKGKRIYLLDAYSGNDEGYSLKVSTNSIEIRGSEVGIFWGIQSLIQVVDTYSSECISVPGIEVDDEPRFPYRGIMQDVGYHIYPVEFIKKEIDLLAKYKMNIYHWHLTEDHGWRIESKVYPKLNQVSSFRNQTCVCNYNHEYEGLDGQRYGGYYTQEEIKDIVAYAADRHVTIIPEIELPGHTLAVLAAYPELSCTGGPFNVAEYWGIYEDVFCAGKEETFAFLEKVFDEILELFPSKYIHIGGDECPKDRWEHCPLCQARIKEEGLSDEFELQSWFIHRIEKYLQKKGREIIGWDEILEGKMSPSAIVMNWRDTSEAVKALKKGHRVIMSPNEYIYFDYIQGDRAQEPFAIGWGYNPMEKVYCYEPFPKGITDQMSKNIIGVEAPLWTEHMDTYRKVEYMLLPRLLALSEVAWSPADSKNLKNFVEERVPTHLSWLDEANHVYRVPTPIGMRDEVRYGEEFVLELTCPIKGGSIYYNFDGQCPRETDYLYVEPLRIHVPKGEAREIKAIVISPSGKRSNVVTTIFDNRAPADYLVGSSKSSLEPPCSIFSTTLAGYGFPAEGRFSIDWETCYDVGAISCISGYEHWLYAVTPDAKFIIIDINTGAVSKLESSENIALFTFAENQIIGIGKDNGWYTCIDGDELNWTPLQSNLADVTAICYDGGYLYACTSGNHLFRGKLAGNHLNWELWGPAEDVVSLTADNGYLFALTSNSTIWKRDMQQKDILWTRIGYNNAETFNIDLTGICVVNDRMYAVSKDYKICRNVHRSQENLFVTAMAIKKDDKTIVLTGADLTGFDYSFIHHVKKKIYEKTGVPEDAIMINASHTHFAPVSQHWYTWQEPNQHPDKAYMYNVVEPAIVSAVENAIANMQPSRLLFNRTTAEIGGNRSLPDDFKYYDPSVDVLNVIDLSGKCSGLLFSAACHPVFRNEGSEAYTLSGNFPSFAKEILEKRYDIDHAVFLQGCAGDVNPIYADARHTGSILASAVERCLDKLMSPVTGDLSYRIDSLLVPVGTPDKREIERIRTSNLPHIDDLECAKNVRWADIMMSKINSGSYPEYMPIYIHTLNIGNWKIIGLSREAVSRYSNSIRNIWPEKNVTVLGYTNDVSSYLPDSYHIDAHTYEGDNSFFWYCQPQIFPRDILNRIVEQIRNQNY